MLRLLVFLLLIPIKANSVSCESNNECYKILSGGVEVARSQYSNCRRITNNKSLDLMAPYKTTGEWSAFIGATITNVTIASTCFGTMNWANATCSSPSSCTATNTNVTVINSGNIHIIDDCTLQYRINSGTYTSIASGSTLAVTNGQTLNWRCTNILCDDPIRTVTLRDTDSAGPVIDAITFDNTGLCP